MISPPTALMLDGVCVSPEDLGLSLVLTFADQAGRTCNVTLADIVRAFLDLETWKLVPEVDTEWRSLMRRAIEVFDRPRFETSEMERKSDRASFPSLSNYWGLASLHNVICETCGAQCHAIFLCDGEEYYIERWSIVSSVVLLTVEGPLPVLSYDFHFRMRSGYEQISETGRQVYRACGGGVVDV